MKRTLLFAPALLVLVMLLGLFAAGCAPVSVEAALQATETPTANEEAEQAPAEQASADDQPAEQTTGDESSGDEQPVAEATPIPDANCITCHQDAEQLQLVAEEVVEEESLNEGSG